MKNNLIITKMQLSHPNTHSSSEYIVNTLLDSEKKIVEISCDKNEKDSLLGNVYIGKVKNIAKNIQAAFIEIENGIICYYSIAENVNPIYTKKSNSKFLVEGDELLVQVCKENIKTKAPVVTGNLNFSGKYVVLTSGNQRVGISNKLDLKQRKKFLELLAPYQQKNYGIVIRTNAQDATKQQIVDELNELEAKLEKLLAIASYRTCFSCLYEAPTNYLASLKNVYAKDLSSILTDDEVLFENIYSYLKDNQREDLEKLQLYKDPLLSISKLYSLETGIENALKERVWLKSGAYLIIQPTEALVVIDVNSGKNISRKKVQENFLKINLEAAKEIAYQLRLRNLSGICIVDFIDLTSKEAKEELMQTFWEYLKVDSVPVDLVGMTKLNLVELTRKKVRKPLHEQLK